MSRADRVRECLGAQELLVGVFAATLEMDSGRSAVSVGLTDRRLVCVADDGTFLAVGYDAVSTVQSHRVTTRTVRGADYRLGLVAGGLVAVAGFAAVAALAPTPLVVLLAGAAVGGLVTTEYLRRDATDNGWETYASEAGTTEFAMVAGGVAALASGIGVLLVAQLAFVGTLVVFAGLALADYARRRRAAFDGFELVRRDETEVTITTESGRAVHLRSDSTDGLGTELGRLAHAQEDDRERVESGPISRLSAG